MLVVNVENLPLENFLCGLDVAQRRLKIEETGVNMAQVCSGSCINMGKVQQVNQHLQMEVSFQCALVMHIAST